VVEGPGLSAVPDRASVLIRRARERVRRAVIPNEVSQVGWVEVQVDRETSADSR
jgi:hypothetical protein